MASPAPEDGPPTAAKTPTKGGKRHKPSRSLGSAVHRVLHRSDVTAQSSLVEPGKPVEAPSAAMPERARSSPAAAGHDQAPRTERAGKKARAPPILLGQSPADPAAHASPKTGDVPASPRLGAPGTRTALIASEPTFAERSSRELVSQAETMQPNRFWSAAVQWLNEDAEDDIVTGDSSTVSLAQAPASALSPPGVWTLPSLVAWMAVHFPANDRQRHQQPLPAAFQSADSMFMTHPWFTTSTKLMALFHAAMDPGDHWQDQIGADSIELLQTSVCRLLRYWIERYPETLESSSDRRLYDRFVGHLSSAGRSELALMLEQARQVAFSTRPSIPHAAKGVDATARLSSILTAPASVVKAPSSDESVINLAVITSMHTATPALGPGGTVLKATQEQSASVSQAGQASTAVLSPTPVSPPECEGVADGRASASTTTDGFKLSATSTWEPYEEAAMTTDESERQDAADTAAPAKLRRRGISLPPRLNMTGTVQTAAADAGPAMLLPAIAHSGWGQPQDLLGMPSLAVADSPLPQRAREPGNGASATDLSSAALLSPVKVTASEAPATKHGRPAVQNMEAADSSPQASHLAEVSASATTAAGPSVSAAGGARDGVADPSASNADPADAVLGMTSQLRRAYGRRRSSLEFNFLDAPTELIASQLTYLDFELYRQIRPIDFYRYRSEAARSGVSRATSADGIAASVVSGDATGNRSAKARSAASPLERMVQQFNAVALWVVQMVLSEPTLKARGRMLTKFIKLAKKLWLLHNYNGMMAVYAGLTHRSIFRLRQTFEEVPRKYQLLFGQMGDFLAHDNNFGLYRQELSVQKEFCVPYMGVVLSDMVHMKDVMRGAMRGAEDTTDLVPWSKMQACASVLRRALSYQQAQVPFIAMMHLVRVLQLSLVPVVTEDELVELSREREPGPSTSSGLSAAVLAPEASAPLKSKTVEDVSSALTNLLLAGSSNGSDASETAGYQRLTQQIEDMVNAIFDTFDVDGNNAISPEEFRNLASYFPFVYSFGTMDADQDGLISREELVSFFLKARNPTYNKTLHKLLPHTLRFAPSTKCDVCGRSIWSFTSTYYRCSKCGIACHGRCREKIVSHCEPLDHTSITSSFVHAVATMPTEVAMAVSVPNPSSADAAPSGSMPGALTVPSSTATAALISHPDTAPAAPARLGGGADNAAPADRLRVRTGFSSIFTMPLSSRPSAGPPRNLKTGPAQGESTSNSASTTIGAGPPSAQNGFTADEKSSTADSSVQTGASAGVTLSTISSVAVDLQRMSLELEMRLQEEQQLMQLLAGWLDDGDLLARDEEGASVSEDAYADLRASMDAISRQLARLNSTSQAASRDIRQLVETMPRSPSSRP